MECPATIEEWFKESISCYNKSLKDNVSLYNEDRSKFFFRQYLFASEYALRLREQEVDGKIARQINVQVRHWFAMLPEEGRRKDGLFHREWHYSYLPGRASNGQGVARDDGLKTAAGHLSG